MTGVAVTVLLGVAAVVLSLRAGPSRRAESVSRGDLLGRQVVGGPGGSTARATASGVSFSFGRTAPRVELHELPLFVHQLAGLLRAGRPSHALWNDMQRLHDGGGSSFSKAAVPIIESAGRAAALGLNVPRALREAAVSEGRPNSGSQHEVDRLWVDLAGCLEVSERSGAPLAAILERYASQLDADLDGVAGRETALAGPRATVVLLAWLPAVGLALGFALGINPLELLTSSLLGRLSLMAGVLLMLTARWWSRRLIRHAAGGTP